jgi:predicted Ser/Thr protein kinase
MNTSHLCPKCGQPVPADAPEGLCPRCVAALNLDSETGVTGAGAAAATPPPSAQELAPHFPQLEILEVLGRGGMGVVYKVRQKELDRIAALKILPPGIGADPAFGERFAREAKALAKLNHPGIVTIYDSGRTDGLFYFLMEFVDGVSLARLMHGGRVSPREALAIVPQICDALQYAHDQGIVHRDIKPENILLDRQGRVKVADFGLAKLMGANAPSQPPGEGGAPAPGQGAPVLTEAGKVMGTPQYMAPEQAEHPGEVDHRADIYALGVVFYQMLTGELPGKRIEPPSRKVQINVHLDEIVLRALEREPERRYQTAVELKTVVETVVAETMKLAGAGGFAPGAGPGSVRRWSRLALAGAGCVGFFLVVIVLRLLDWPPSRDPSFGRTLPQILFSKAVLPASFAALFASTILGWTAVVQIRRSAGRLRGLGWAVFDGLFLPLLTVDVIILTVWAIAVKVLAASRGLGGSMFRNLWDFAAFVLLLGLVTGWVDYLIIRPVWRAIAGSTGGDAPSSVPRRRRHLRWVAAALGLSVIILYPAYVISNENSRKARYGWAVEGRELHYQVFEADAALVDRLVPFDSREPGNALSSAGTYTLAPSYTAVAQMAEIEDSVLAALRQDATTNSGLLVDATKEGREIYLWRPDHWGYTNALASGKGEGFCGMGRNRSSSVLFRIRYRVSHVAGGNARYPVTAEISYEGRTPPPGKARAFFIPFGRDQQAKYLVIAFEAKAASKGTAAEPPAGKAPEDAVKH